MDAMVTGRQRRLKMPRPDAYGLAAPERHQDRSHPALRPLGLAGAPPDVAPQSATPAVGPALHGAKDQESGHGNSARASGGSKSFVTLAAELVRRGFELHATTGGTYIVARWNLARELPSLREVGDMLRRLGGVL